MCLAIDLHENFVKMPSPVRVIWGRMKTLLPDLAREQGTKSVPPIAHNFVTNIDASFMEKIFDVAKG